MPLEFLEVGRLVNFLFITSIPISITYQLLKYKELIEISFVAMLISEEQIKQQKLITDKEAYMSKNLIIYYSRKGENYVNGRIVDLPKGNTEICAEFIQKAVGGDLFEIETVAEYSNDYSTCTDEAKRELHENARPELKRYLDSIDEYENVFVCGPCWWGTYPVAVFTQLERLDFTGKKVMALMTHEGSGLGNSERDLRRMCKGVSFGTGIAIHGADAAKSEKSVADWARKCVE